MYKPFELLIKILQKFERRLVQGLGSQTEDIFQEALSFLQFEFGWGLVASLVEIFVGLCQHQNLSSAEKE